MLEGLRHLFSARPPDEVVRDVVDILVITVLVYRSLLVLKGTRAMQMGLGIIVFGALYFVARYAQLTTVSSLLSWLASSAVLIIVVVFQNDIRRALIRLGGNARFARGRDAQERLLDEVVAAATELARHRMGAIICLERDANVLEFVKSEGVTLDSEVSRELLVSMFVPEGVNKLHDGAVLIRDLRIARAGVFLPMPEATKIADNSFGSRHRAAIGITEETDAVVIVVSEERGTITLCFSTGMLPNVDGHALKQTLRGLLGEGKSPRRDRGDASLAREQLGSAQHGPKAPPSEPPGARERLAESDRPSEARPSPFLGQVPPNTAKRLEAGTSVVRTSTFSVPPRPIIVDDTDVATVSSISGSRPMTPTEIPATLSGVDQQLDVSPAPGAVRLEPQPMHDPSASDDAS